MYFSIVELYRSQNLTLATRMATLTLGCLEPFDATKEDWSAYTERFDQFVLENGVEEEKKIVATFLTMWEARLTICFVTC